MEKENPINREQQPEKSFESSLLDENDANRKSVVEDIFSRNEQNTSDLKWVEDENQKAEIVNLISEYSLTQDVGQRKKIRKRIEIMINRAYEEAHKQAA